MEEEPTLPPTASALSRDTLLHHVMTFMKAWDAVRTCVLSRRWRDLWASAPCVDIRVGRYSDAPEDYTKFVYRLLLAREALAPVETLRLHSRGEDDDDEFDTDVRMWIRHAIRRKVWVIQLTGHAIVFAQLDSMDFVSRHLKILKLSYANVFDSFTMKLSSRCPSLEELELKDCLVEGHGIIHVSLKRLTMVKCAFLKNFLVDAPNLVFVRCIAPERWVPLFKNFGALATGSVMFDDSLLSYEFGYQVDDDEFAQTSDDDDDDNNNSTYARSIGKPITASDDSDEFISDDSDFSDDFCDEYSDDIKDNHDYGSDINSDSGTYEYSEIANGHEDKQFENLNDGHDCTKGSKYHGCNAMYATSDCKSLGGQNVLHSLSNAQNLELLGHSGEVHTKYCSTELKSGSNSRSSSCE